MERECIKKGPWSKEEDEVLQKHVSKFGPRDWSSIRSKGLLLRTGKSCRLRWVNKLRPNLKTGCKFSREEERTVVELQGQFGNKWAKIARDLEGRTDNDVKNFWSSRRKRLERMLQRTTTSPSKPHKHKGKALLHHNNINQLQLEEEPSWCSNKPEETLSLCCNYLHYPIASYMGNTEDEFKMVNLPDLTKPNYQNLESELNSIHMVPSFESSTTDYTFPQLPEPQMEFPLFPEPQDLVVAEAIDPNNFIDDVFDHKKCGTSLPSLGFGGSSQSKKSPGGFFEDFPAEIFEYFHNVPTSSEL